MLRGLLGKETSKVKNGFVLESVRGDFINNWREFDNSVQQLANEYAQQILKTDKKWISQKTNMKYKEGKKYFGYIKKKLDTVR